MSYREHFEHRYARDLDGARGVLALCVVLLHYGFNSFSLRVSHGLLPGATFQLCVDAFFILSGYVLTSSVRRARPSAWQFAGKRFFRLAPIFFLTTLIALLFPPPEYVWRFAPLETVGWVPFLNLYPANAPSWSVSFEFYLPIVAFALAPRFPVLSRRACRIALMIGLVTLAILDANVMLERVLYLPRAVVGLACGHFLFGADLRRAVDWRPWMTPALLAGALLVMVLASLAPAAALVFPFLICCLVLSGATHDSAFLSSRPAQWLGSISYTLYMVHVPLLQVAERLAGSWFGQNPVTKLVLVGLSLAAAAALTRFVELPCMDYYRRLTSGRAVPAA